MSTGQPWFGTDGMRGAFREPPLDEATVRRLGFELAALLAEDHGAPEVVIAGDTRDSTLALVAWLAAGLADGGARARFAGVLPTPAAAWLTRDLGAAAGVAVSASHNPWPDNGIKLIGGDGFKWPVAREQLLEARLRASNGDFRDSGSTPPAVEPGLASRYRAMLLRQLPAGAPLAGLRVVLDTANGAACELAGEIFSRLGAHTRLINAAPDGRNINRECGSTHPAGLAATVVAERATLGIAFDGDADRALLVDADGEVRDGDAMMYLWARHLMATGALSPPTIVATSMSNLGLERALARHGIGVLRCDVGDRAVVETLRARSLALGGEQSGHIVCLRAGTTGDGLLTALTLCHVLAQSGRSLAELLSEFRRYPQLLRNIRVPRQAPFESLPRVVAARRSVERQLGTDGRLVLRYSGTEPLARIMIEGPDQAVIEGLAGELEVALRAELGA